MLDAFRRKVYSAFWLWGLFVVKFERTHSFFYLAKINFCSFW
jgi:hypothetical protein